MSEGQNTLSPAYLPVLLGDAAASRAVAVPEAGAPGTTEAQGGADERRVVPLSPDRLARAKVAYSVHAVPDNAPATLVSGRITPAPGDLVLARVRGIGQHTRLELRDGRRAYLFRGDEVVVCYGNRYAPDQFEAEVPFDLGPCDLVAAGGIAARMVSRHKRMKKPTRIMPVGLLGDVHGRPLNLRQFALRPVTAGRRVPVMAAVGTSMNSGKTTAAADLIRGLSAAGHRVGSAKVTGTGAGGDTWHAIDAGATRALNFADAGVPSTYLVSEAELLRVFTTLTGTLAASGVDAIILEVADGLPQRETAMLLRSPAFRDFVDGIVFAATDALGAVAGAQWLAAEGLSLKAVAGCLTASPLALRETAASVDVPVLTRAQLADPARAAALFDLPVMAAAETDAEVDAEAEEDSGDVFALAG